ncbi:pseudouridine synthase [Endozoicomonas numazuensis]|uniref:Dual-specificity RNA pseudouridine synthase RluA n=1 Tax=Endozoicomonas numazuensis TaxID=1137799 RepID=A0A081NGL2_9GAMM|nr:pseudouridine synthase [Endozoicomonas numazuensis]KEQ17585.1 pseudouridine synthase [Endozoicomonas numazuensis]
MTFIVPPCQDPLTELYRDSDLVVVEKPAGLLSVPGRPPNDKDSAHARLLAIEPETRVVHRLDMSTSGLMVFGLNADSHRELSRQFQDREVEKGYIAEVWGMPEQASGEISLPLICDWPNRPRQMVDYEQGKKALTRYQLMAGDSSHGKVWLEPVTGRSHQLRVHMAEIGHPILGCEFYAHNEARAASERLHLHASLLIFKHPTTGESMKFESQPPF